MAIRRLALAVLLSLLAGSSASAGPPTERLEGLFGEASRILADPATVDRPIERLRAILTLVVDAFDWRSAAERALGRAWHARSAAEQREFVGLFADLLERSFVFGVAARVDANGGVRVRYLGESLDGATATVETAVETRDGREIRLDYRMIERRGRWLVQDVVIDGVSVVANYRSQFQRILRSASYGDLVAQMRARLAEGPIASRIAASEPRRRLARVEEAPPSAPVPTPDETAPAPQAVPIAARLAPVTPMAPARAVITSYWVQVGAFKNPDAARRLAARLGPSGVALSAGGGAGEARGLVHVRVGPFAERREAVAKLLELRTRGHRPFILESRS